MKVRNEGRKETSSQDDDYSPNQPKPKRRTKRRRRQDKKEAERKTNGLTDVRFLPQRHLSRDTPTKTNLTNRQTPLIRRRKTSRG